MAGRAVSAPGALLCALLWAAAAGGPGDNPAPGAFGHIYRGAVNISAERVYAFAYRSEPGQVGATPGAPGSPQRGEHRVPLILSAGGGVCAGEVPALPLCGRGPGSPSVLTAFPSRRGSREPQCTCGLLPTFPGAGRAPQACGLGGCRCPGSCGVSRWFGAPHSQSGGLICSVSSSRMLLKSGRELRG